ncbi:4-hydroxy-tetrahydrodipicolinate reductase [Clostridium sp. DJ247]|uniref:4-hydroxy-tetrahydrodipicolinate reductase n=1 Tax=Clostridium sp. DJ247 TaxID=2726188 RepID=UPI0016277C38|nr:4-hydroxy-tetrahydrodipicolinate reductase [Clostridium sp. DJ247]MBC2580297.1 4-hydroxy-tetrahydrodipicolinate reductase [Clostridium sp. DJ247]
MVRVILSGCNGKMGKVISSISSNFPNLSIVAGIDRNTEQSGFPVFSSISECTVNADVIIDFSRPDILESLLSYAKEKNLGIVLCTTGYTKEQLEKIHDASKELPVFRTANLSIGINIVNKILRNISALLYKDFDIEIVEKHHNQKVDSPSGTALLLANTIKDSIAEETEFVYGREGIAKRDSKEIGIHAVRGGGIVGDHDVIFAGQGEVIEIRHSAISREVFAVGSLRAAEFMYKKENGLYTMDDVLK